VHITKRIDLELLGRELAAASVVVTGLGHQGSDTDGELFQWSAPDEHGTAQPLELPPGAAPVVDAHVAPPRVVEYAASAIVEAVKRTTDAAPSELLRFPLAAMTGYDIESKVMGVDAGSGAVKKLKLDATIKRLGGGPSSVGAPTTTVTHQDSAASAWAVTLTFSGNDALVSVTGAAGRSIDWVCRAEVARFAPAGLGG
jgi:hypothetical protein